MRAGTIIALGTAPDRHGAWGPVAVIATDAGVPVAGRLVVAANASASPVGFEPDETLEVASITHHGPRPDAIPGRVDGFRPDPPHGGSV